MFRRKPEKPSLQNHELLNSIVSLYLYMDKNARFQGREIVFIDRLLRSMFGSAIPLDQIESARRSKVSVREAANCLNSSLKTADRIKIILNLISLAYHERDRIHVLGSVEIVELADLLRLDVNSLDDVYNLFEGCTDLILLPEGIGTPDLLQNSMHWGLDKADIRLDEADLHFVMIENLVLIHNAGPNKCYILSKTQERALPEEGYLRMHSDSILTVGKWQFSYNEIWNIYRNKQQIKELESYLQKRISDSAADLEPTEYYIDISLTGPTIHTMQSAASILRIAKDDGWKIQSLSNTIFRLNSQPLSDDTPFLQNNDILNIAGKNYIVNRHWEMVEIPLQISEFTATDLWYYFKEGNAALKGISFTLQQGNMMAIMGSSGTGKTTLLQLLLGELVPYRSKITIDGLDLLENYSFFQPIMAYVPQDDLLFANLTVYENLLYKLKLSSQKALQNHDVERRIENLLKSVGLYEQRNMIVGDVMNKKLSGGQRRRLNIALELVMNPAILILDEPTSGLSTKDSENSIQFLAELRDQGKIILSTIHQPNATIFDQFDSVLLMDKGGVQVYFGNSREVFDYFAQELKQVSSADLQLKRKLKMPEYFFDLIEYSDATGGRAFPPDYWADKYRDFSFIEAICRDLESPPAEKQKVLQSKSRFEFRKLMLLIKRNFLNKSRSKLNLLMTLFVAPFLALVTAFVLRGTPQGSPYSYYENLNSMLFDFIAVIIFIFIGLANSIDDILSEKRIITRELKLGLSPFSQLFSKQSVLFVMTCIQVLLFYAVAALVLDMRGFSYPKMLFSLLSGISGYSMGLLFSSFIKDRSAVINILPLVIIPQIMFSGAVIKFADMNPAMRIISRSEIPEFCQLVPSRWLFEGLVVSSARLNAYERHKAAYQTKMKTATQDRNLTVDKYMAMVDEFERYEESHPERQYQNKLGSTAVRLAHGKSLSEDRNIFLSYQMKVGNVTMDTVTVDVVAILIFIVLAGAGTWLKLRYGYRR
ncbi:MAG: ATP-binding cassette domain-containing protein [Candidatus Cloacimonetes bacterium]|nr:ATP-binding cassette domain-containing protein [Candidatus Cloacimonadota bacterium]MCK9178905.1 ATP-binding cassette domain-containing protein [Candidatus Cloacimonadota bacterium]